MKIDGEIIFVLEEKYYFFILIVIFIGGGEGSWGKFIFYGFYFFGEVVFCYLL